MNIRTCRRCRTSFSAPCRARAATSFSSATSSSRSTASASPTPRSSSTSTRALQTSARPRPVSRGASSCGRISAPAARCWPAPTTSFPTSCPAPSASWTMTARPACAPEQAIRTTAKSRSLPCSSCRTRTTTRPRRKRPRWRRTTLRGASARSSTAARPCGKTALRAPRTMATWSSCCAAPTASAPCTVPRSRRTASPCRQKRAAGSTRPRRCRCCALCWRWWTIRTRTCRSSRRCARRSSA